MHMNKQKNLVRVRVRVWDLPTRLFHWTLVAGVIGLGITGTLGGSAMAWHLPVAYAVLALLLFRLAWGWAGGRWSRFAAFAYAPHSVIAYLRGKGRPEHRVGHSPVGALSVFAMLGFLLLQVGSGLFSDDEIAFSGPLAAHVSNATVGLATRYHAGIGKWTIAALVALHLAAIAFYLRRKHPLVGAMLHGDKQLAQPAQPSRDDLRSRLAALLIFGLCAAAAYGVATLAAPGL
jgi:cytochrome b